MSYQVPEQLSYQGGVIFLETYPLESYFSDACPRPIFSYGDRSLWRGYRGSWEIVGQRLYMVGLAASYQSGVALTVQKLFRTTDEKVFAGWYSGILEGHRYETSLDSSAGSVVVGFSLTIDRGVILRSGGVGSG